MDSKTVNDTNAKTLGKSVFSVRGGADDRSYSACRSFDWCRTGTRG